MPNAVDEVATAAKTTWIGGTMLSTKTPTERLSIGGECPSDVTTVFAMSNEHPFPSSPGRMGGAVLTEFVTRRMLYACVLRHSFPTAGIEHFFGHSVALSGDRILVSSHRTFVDRSVSNAVYVF